jgi:iron complex outermembrane receptor protein
MNRTPRTHCLLSALAVALGTAGLAHAATAEPPVADLSLEDLLKADVVTASRKSQAVQDVAAAVYVISREDIQHAGATSLPEALRLAPGVSVARLSSGRWAVTARGFNNRFANKLLVLLDGRTIYSPLFSGVLWETEGTLIEDIERIEVIRGPGAALWGANAVNGVINILTRKARDTTGTLVAASAGNVEHGALALRHGGSMANGQWRLWAKTETHGGFDNGPEQPGNNAWRTARAGFRADWQLPSGDGLSLSGAASLHHSDDRWATPSITSPTGISVIDAQQRSNNTHLLARWNHLDSDGSETIAQAYLEDGRIGAVQAFDEHRRTIDLDVQRRPRPQGAHDIVYGGSVRVSHDDTSSTGILDLTPATRTFQLASVFVNDEITLVPERLRATLGIRLEHSNRTGTAPQPQARLAWTPSPVQTVWGAVSRAVRTPSRGENDAIFDRQVIPASGMFQPLPVLLRSTAKEGGLDVEKLTAYELGYRRQIDANLAVDLTAFRNDYSQLISSYVGTQQVVFQPYPCVIQNIGGRNDGRGHTSGWEMALDWRPLRSWRLQATYTRLDMHLDTSAADPFQSGGAARDNGNSPRHQAMLRSSWALDSRHDVDLRWRHVSGLQQDNADPSLRIPAYNALDLRLAWRPQAGLTLALTGENLTQARHAEITSDQLPSQPLQVPRIVRLSAQWLF